MFPSPQKKIGNYHDSWKIFLKCENISLESIWKRPLVALTSIENISLECPLNIF